MLESKSNEIYLKGVSAETFSLILEYIYSRHISITKDNVLNLIGASCILQLDEISSLCCNFMKEKLDPSNVINIRRFSDRMFLNELKEFTTNFLVDNFENVIEHEEFLHLQTDEVIEILKFDVLRVSSEYVVLYAAIKWILSNPSIRKTVALDVLQHIRLMNFANTSYIQRLLEKLPLQVSSVEECEKLLLNIGKRCSKRRMITDESSHPRYDHPAS